MRAARRSTRRHSGSRAMHWQSSGFPCSSGSARSHSRANTNKTALASVRSKSDELERLEREYSWLSMLSQTANDTFRKKDKITLETYIQMTFFDRILQRANGRLLVMSGGQYELKRRSISDNRQSRPVWARCHRPLQRLRSAASKSLSGGESFKASLSLALGLSDEVQSAAAAGIRLDTMFVDEGFGSLDEESLAQAIHALSSLAEENGWSASSRTWESSARRSTAR